MILFGDVLHRLMDVADVNVALEQADAAAWVFCPKNAVDREPTLDLFAIFTQRNILSFTLVPYRPYDTVDTTL